MSQPRKKVKRNKCPCGVERDKDGNCRANPPCPRYFKPHQSLTSANAQAKQADREAVRIGISHGRSTGNKRG